MTAITSARGLLSLLDEPDPNLQIHALEQLNIVVEQFWPEIAAAIPKIETLYETDTFPSRPLAASVASKVYYHLEELDDALRFALGAGELFDVSALKQNEYVNTLIAKFIDEYCRLRQIAYTDPSQQGIDDRLVAIVERMLECCFSEGKFKQAIGIAIESRRLDVVNRAIHCSNNPSDLLSYVYRLSRSTVNNRKFREELLKEMIQLYRLQATLESGVDYINMCQCFLFLNDHQSVASTLSSLLDKKSSDATLMAYQIAFDLGENQNQAFLNRVADALPNGEEEKKSNDAMDLSSNEGNRLKTLKHILSGTAATELYMHFLYEQSHTDINLLKQIKDKLELRNSVTHNATVMAHGLMQCGTTVDAFLRDNLEWLGKAQNWAKFSATASLGVVHKGHYKESMKLLQPYLPQAGQSGSAYQEGGALYALGLIHSAAQGSTQIQFLSDALRNAGAAEPVQHGACLGLGLCGMATNNMSLIEQLKAIVMQESAVAGEAAGISMGLILVGSGNSEVIEEMLAYAHETKHDKIIRGLALGIALIYYGQEEQADTVIEQLCIDKDPLLRYGGMFAIALAYACTSNNNAIRRLLHVAVSDVSDDVRRAAVTSLGFVLADQPETAPKAVALLAESYNPHVRYGAALAVGIACAAGARGREEALKVLMPLVRDRVDFVRQGAFIACAMVLIQQNETSEPQFSMFRAAIGDALAVKSDTMTKLGAILASGIVDAGGRNVTISLLSSSGHKQMQSIVGLALFPQFWYWYPLVHMLSLSFTSTALICLNERLLLPKPIVVVSKSKPSTFAYPEPIDLNAKEEKKELKQVTLSVTAKQQQKLKKKEQEHSMEVDKKKEENNQKIKEEKSDNNKMDVDTSKHDKKEERKEKNEPEEIKEPNFTILRNPSRVTDAQQPILAWPRTQRYKPIKPVLAGIVMVKDTQPEHPEELIENKEVKVKIAGIDENEPAPPAPFEYTG